MRRLSSSIAAGMFMLVALPGSALAVPPGNVDQSTGAGSILLAYGADLAQTFTVGQTGLLTGVQLYIFGPGSFSAQIKALDGSGFPTGSDLATASGSAGAGFAWVDLVFATPLAVTTGDTYAVVFLVPDVNSMGWDSDAYAGGRALMYDTASSAWGPASGLGIVDFSFRTYVQSPTPTRSPQATTPPTTTSRDEAPGSGSPVWMVPLALILLAGATLLVAKRQPRVIR